MLLNSLKPWIIALWRTNTTRWWGGQSRRGPSCHLGPLYWRQSFTADLSYLGLWCGWTGCCCAPLCCWVFFCSCYATASQFYLFFVEFFLTVFCLTHFCWELWVSCSWSWLCHPISVLLPTLLFVGSICDLIQFTNVGENDQWRVSAGPFHSFSDNEPRNQFSLLRELLS